MMQGIQVYLKRVELYLVANEVGEDQSVPAFLSVNGSNTYALLRDLLGLVKPSEKTFAELKLVLERKGGDSRVLPFSPEEPSSRRVRHGVCRRTSTTNGELPLR